MFKDQEIIVSEKPKRKLTPEHAAKIKAARDAYWAKRRELKESVPPAYTPTNDEVDFEPPVNKVGRPAKGNMSDAREKIVERIYKKKEKLIDAMIDTATGLYYTAENGKHIYMKKPDTSKGEYLLNQLIGKPKESIEVKTVNLMVDI